MTKDGTDKSGSGDPLPGDQQARPGGELPSIALTHRWRPGYCPSGWSLRGGELCLKRAIRHMAAQPKGVLMCPRGTCARLYKALGLGLWLRGSRTAEVTSSAMEAPFTMGIRPRRMQRYIQGTPC